MEYKIKNLTIDKEGHYIMIKGPTQEEDITIINIYVPNIGAPKYKKKILTNIKREIASNTIIAENFNTPLTSIDRLSRQKINKETLAINDIVDQMDLMIHVKHSIHKQEHTPNCDVDLEPFPLDTCFASSHKPPTEHPRWYCCFSSNRRFSFRLLS